MSPRLFIPLVIALLGTTGLAQLPLRYAVPGSSTGRGRLGFAVAGVGDLDGDGHDDIAVAVDRDVGAAPGIVEILSGATGARLFGVVGESPTDAFGASIAAIGDVDGDGTSEIAIGAPANDGLLPDTGSVEVRSIASGALISRVFGEASNHGFGEVLAGGGDVNADGKGDVLVGVPTHDGSGPQAGRVLVLSGADGSTLLQVSGASGERLGTSVAFAGDVDGDGCDDLVAGAPRAAPNGTASGRAVIISGATGNILAAFNGAAAGDNLGAAVAGLGDIDGDAVPDVALGASGADSGAFQGGAVEVRSGATGALIRAHHGSAPLDRLGLTLAGVGDVDGDGIPDLAAGAPLATGPGARSGYVVLFSGADGTALATIAGSSGERWGDALAGAGDVDGDGKVDVVIGGSGELVADGRVAVHAASGAVLLTAASGLSTGEFGFALSTCDDLDGDGIRDVLVGATSRAP